jgi:hypothetical protein
MASNYLFLQSEKVRQKLQEWVSKWQVVSNLIKPKEVEWISERDFRIPYQGTLGGRIGTFDPNMGDMGRGTAFTGGYGVGTTFPLRLNYELPLLAVWGTDKSEKALVNAFNKCIKSAPETFALYRDKLFHGDGTAVLGTATATGTWDGGAKTTYTLANAGGVQKFVRGQYLNIYPNALNASKDALLYIDHIDTVGKVLYLSGAVGGAGALLNDKFCLEGVSGASPAGPKTLYYSNDYATSGSTYGVDRAVESEVIASSVNAAGGLSTTHAVLLAHRMWNRRGGIGALKGVIGLSGTAQHAAVLNSAVNISMVDISGGNKALDLVPGMDTTFKFGGVVHHIDPHQNQDRIDWINPANFGIARQAPVDYFKVPGSDQRFFDIKGTSGAPSAGVWFGLCSSEDTFNVDPGAGGVIYGLTYTNY